MLTRSAVVSADRDRPCGDARASEGLLLRRRARAMRASSSTDSSAAAFFLQARKHNNWCRYLHVYLCSTPVLLYSCLAAVMWSSGN